MAWWAILPSSVDLHGGFFAFAGPGTFGWGMSASARNSNTWWLSWAH